MNNVRFTAVHHAQGCATSADGDTPRHIIVALSAETKLTLTLTLNPKLN